MAPHEFRFIALIEAQYIKDPFGFTYRGDGPGFSYEREEFRTRHTIVIDPDLRRVGGNVAVSDEKQTGISYRYITLLQASAGRAFLTLIQVAEDQANAEASMSWELDPASPCQVALRFRGHGANPVAASRWLGIVPEINYDVRVLFDLSARKVTIKGEHDGFPAYDFYFDKEPFRQFSALGAGTDPLSLFGTSDQAFGPWTKSLR